MRSTRIGSVTKSFAIQLLLLVAASSSAQEIADQWRYTLRPADGWQLTDFDSSTWKEGFGGFGTPGTPGARIGTPWTTNNIWLRKTFQLSSVPAKPALLVHHDEDAEIFVNGQQVAALERWSTEYKVVPLDDDGRKALRAGKNVLAVHCRQQNGGQFIDVHIVDAQKVPKLPRPARSTKPFKSELITKWGAEVTADNAWTEYPRPQLMRDSWQNLNGHWDYAITPVDQQTIPSEWAGKILVPYCLESKLGGVQRLLDAAEALWYRRTFRVEPSNAQRTLLNFEAVDYRCVVLVNGKRVGEHQGGNTPFSFDVTDVLKDGQNELVVRVEDETEGWQLHGKQVLNARGIWYTQVSGIWQTVWLERVAASYIEDLKIETDAAQRDDQGGPVVAIVGAQSGDVRVVVKDGEKVVAEDQGNGKGTVDRHRECQAVVARLAASLRS